MRTADCHPGRKHYARGMCASCYVVAQRKGFPDPYRRRYTEQLMEELDFIPMDWSEVEAYTGRDRSKVAQSLRYQEGGREVVKTLNKRTYGTTNPWEITRMRCGIWETQ